MPGMRCTVAICSNSRLNVNKTGKSISFYRFPKNKELRQIWVQRCRRDGKWNPDNCRVCSDHFCKEDYERNLQAELLKIPTKKKLKPAAVPSLKLFEAGLEASEESIEASAETVVAPEESVVTPEETVVTLPTPKLERRSHVVERTNKLLVKDILAKRGEDISEYYIVTTEGTVLSSTNGSPASSSQISDEDKYTCLLEKYEAVIKENKEIKRQLQLNNKVAVNMSNCSVFSCRNHRRSTALHRKDISYHRFPKNEDIREKWLKAVQPRKAVTGNSYICSVHFLEDDFERNLQAELLTLPKKRRLKPRAVPSLYLDECVNDNIEDTVKGISPVTYKYCTREAVDNPIATSKPDIKHKAIIQRIDTLERLNNELLTSQESVLLNSKSVPCSNLGKDSDNDPLLDSESKYSTPVVGATASADDLNDTRRSEENIEYVFEESSSEASQDKDKQESYSKAEGNLRCRTCLEDIEMYYLLTDVAHVTKTIKEMIIFCVPQMASTLSDDDVICDNCLDALQFCVNFIETCLEVEENIQSFNKGNSSAYNDQENCNPPNTMDYVKVEHDYIIESEPERTSKCKTLMQPSILQSLLVNQRQQTDSNIKKNQQQSNAQLFNCPNCDKILKSQKFLVNHIMRVHSKMSTDDETQENLMELKSNDKVCPQVEEFPEITDRELFPCLHCGKLFKMERYLLKHLRRVHDLIKSSSAEDKKGVSKKVGKLGKKYVCKFCKCTFLGEESYRLHLKKHKGRDSDICRVCGLKFDNKQDLIEHRRQHGIICSVCFEGFSTRGELNKHREIHPDIFFCRVCGKGFKMMQSLSAHAEVHSAYCFYCSECGKGFKSNAALKYHKIIHDPEKKLKCDKCPSTFQDKTKLKLHQRTVHEKIKEYQCSKCDKKFGLKIRLKYHYRLIHLKLKMFQCEICGKKFGTRYNLRRHADQHCNEPKAKLRGEGKLKQEHLTNKTKEVGSEKLEKYE